MAETVQGMIDVGSRPNRSSGLRRLALAVSVLLFCSLALNAFLGWRVERLRRAVDRVSLERQLEIGSSVPPIRVRGADGRSTLIGYEQSERATVLYFFSPGCDTCERNIENIKKLVERKSGEYRFVGLSLADDEPHEYAKSQGLNFPVYGSLGVETTLAYKLGRVPQTTIVSPDGRVLANWHGAYDSKLRPAIESYFQTGF